MGARDAPTALVAVIQDGAALVGVVGLRPGAALGCGEPAERRRQWFALAYHPVVLLSISAMQFMSLSPLRPLRPENVILCVAASSF
jgi:hypothetical protein